MTITLSDPGCTATGASLDRRQCRHHRQLHGDDLRAAAVVRRLRPAARCPRAPSAPAAGRSLLGHRQVHRRRRQRHRAHHVRVVRRPAVPRGTTLTQSSANSASTPYSTNAGVAGTTYTYTAVASNGTAPSFTVPQLSVTVASAPPPPPPTTGAPDCRAQGFANTRFIRLDWNNATRFYTKDVGGFGPDDALVLELTVPTNATVSNTLRTISGAEWIDLGVPRSAFLSTKACDFTSAVFGYGSESAGASFGVSFAVSALGGAPSAGRWAFPSPIPPKVPAGTTIYVNVKN